MEKPAPAGKKIVYIVNPISGKGKQSRIGAIITKESEDLGIQSEIVFTERPGHAKELARKAVSEGASVVVAVGGDGTVNEVAAGLLGSEGVMGIVPTGSGNGLARHLRLPLRFRDAVRVIIAGKQARIDTGTLNGRPFVSVAGAGFDAVVAKRFANTGQRGFFTYARTAFKAYFGYRQRKFRFNADGVEYVRKGIFVSFANSNQFGNNVSVAPMAELDDGYLDICVVRKIPFISLMFLAPAVFLKQIHKTKFVEIIRAREIFLERKKGKWVHLDGDPWKAGKQIHVKISPLSLSVIVP
jgi:diacylglycerol kinase (ATP)